MAYKKATKMGFGLREVQHIDTTTHGELILKCKQKLKGEGWHVEEEQNDIRRIIRKLGAKGNPDLCATRSGETIFVEVYTDDKRFLNQLAR